MKYLSAIFITAFLIFLGVTFYYKGLPNSSESKNIATPVNTVSPSPVAVATSPAQAADENITIVSAMQEALIAEHGDSASSLNITISKVEGNYAQGGASGQGGGGMWFAAKVLGAWKLIWDGNGQINCADIAPYPAFPKDMISECWDTTANKIIAR